MCLRYTSSKKITSTITLKCKIHFHCLKPNQKIKSWEHSICIISLFVQIQNKQICEAVSQIEQLGDQGIRILNINHKACQMFLLQRTQLLEEYNFERVFFKKAKSLTEPHKSTILSPSEGSEHTLILFPHLSQSIYLHWSKSLKKQLQFSCLTGAPVKCCDAHTSTDTANNQIPKHQYT